MSNHNFLNTTEIAEELNVTVQKVAYEVKQLGLVPCGKIKGKPSSHKSGKVWKAKQFRILRKHFLKLAA